jgi:hypothetical protein
MQVRTKTIPVKFQGSNDHITTGKMHKFIKRVSLSTLKME